MANVLGEEKRDQILALGRLGWSLRRIEREIHVRRETAGQYLHAAGIPVRRRGGLASSWPPWPKSAAAGAKPATTEQVITDSQEAKPATTAEVITDSAVQKVGRSPTASACEPYRELIEQGLRLGRNVMAIYQDLVTDHGFTARYHSVRRFTMELRDQAIPEGHPGAPRTRRICNQNTP
jgi:hypothetical protein